MRPFMLPLVLACLQVVTVTVRAQQRPLRILLRAGPAMSHYLIVSETARVLENRGHTLTWLVFDNEGPTLAKVGLQNASTIVCSPPDGSYFEQVLESVSANRMTKSNVNSGASLVKVHQQLSKAYPPALPAVKAGIFDLMIADIFASDLLDLPLVVLAPFGSNFAGFWFNTPSAISLRGSFYPLWMPTPLTSTWQRIQALGEWALDYYLLTTAVSDMFDGAWHQLGMADQGISSSTRRAAAILVQGSHVIWPAVPASPHIHTLPMNVQRARPLPQDLAALADAARSLLFISMGTSAIAEPELLRSLHALAASRAGSVIWRLSEKDQKSLQDTGLTAPANTHIVAFVPQQDLLAHPALRERGVFLTQAGSASFMEALWHGTPMLILPLFGEQDANGRQAQLLGAAVSIPQKFPLQSGTLIPQLEAGLRKVLWTSSIRARAHEISALMQAERWTPAEQAASVVERVGWTNGSRHNSIEEQSWVVRHGKDVFVFLLLAAATAIALIAWAVHGVGRVLLRIVRRQWRSIGKNLD